LPIGVHLRRLAFKQRRHLADVREHHRAAAPGTERGVHVRRRRQRRRVHHQRQRALHCQHRRSSPGNGRPFAHARGRSPRRRCRRSGRKARDRRIGEPAVLVLGMPRDQRSGMAMASGTATLSTVAICSLPAPARSAAVPASSAPARHGAAAADDQNAPAVVLVVGAVMRGNRESLQRVRSSGVAPVFASGSSRCHDGVGRGGDRRASSVIGAAKL
jgi:hypothetical protein